VVVDDPQQLRVEIGAARAAARVAARGRPTPPSGESDPGS
jgi:hypothetical protein